MHIPDKYRKMYDNLALSHPWMREMRDADDAQEGNAVKKLREFIDDQFVSGKTAWTQGMEIADMVERDYVSRETHSKAADIWQAASDEWEKRCKKAEAQRNRLKDMNERLQIDWDVVVGWDEQRKQLEAERDEALEIRDKALGDAATFKYERDELKRVLDMDSRIRASQDSAIEEIARQRDKWEAKAEGFAEALEKLGCSVLANGTVFEGSSKVRAGSSKSAKRAAAVERLRHLWNACIKDTRQLFGALVDKGAPIYAERSDFDALIDLLEDGGVTNLEWYFVHDEEFRTAVGNLAFAKLDEAPEQPYKVTDWLMAPHMDAQRDSNETCPDGDKTCPNHSKAHSTTEPNLTEQSESLSDEGGEMSDEIQESLNSDTREKLEADIYNHTAISITPNKDDDGVLAPYATVLEWLDRQDAITRRELQGEVDRLKRENAALAADLAESESLRRAAEAEVIAAKTAKDYWRELCDQKAERDE